MDGWWNQMDALAEQLAIHKVGVCSKTQRHPDYVSPETDLLSHPHILNKKNLHGLYHKCFNGIAKFRNYDTTLNEMIMLSQ